MVRNILILVSLFSFNIFSQALEIPKPDPLVNYTFDYTKANQNDCWDVNTAVTWGTVNVGASPDKATICKNLVFYEKLSERAEPTGCSSDPVCAYYKAAYSTGNKILSSNLVKINAAPDAIEDTRAKGVKACQWLPGPTACVPRNEIYIASAINVKDEATFGYIKKDLVIKAITANPQTVPFNAAIIQKFKHLVGKKDAFLIKSLGLFNEYSSASVAIQPNVSFLSYEKFKLSDGTYPKAIVDCLANAFRSGQKTNNDCSVAVLTVAAGAVKATKKDDKAEEASVETSFIYHDNYFSFIPLAVTQSANGVNSYEIKDEHPESIDDRYEGFCRDTEFFKDGNWPAQDEIKKMINMQAIIGYFDGRFVSKSETGSVPTIQKIISASNYCLGEYNLPGLDVSDLWDEPYTAFVKELSTQYRIYSEAIDAGKKEGSSLKGFSDYLSGLKLLQNPNYKTSKFYESIKTALSSCPATKVAGAYCNELKNIFAASSMGAKYQTTEFKNDVAKLGEPLFFYKLADNIFFTITKEAQASPQQWMFAAKGYKEPELKPAASTSWLRPHMFKDYLYKFDNLLFPSLLAGNDPGALIASAQNVYYFKTNYGAYPAYNQVNSVEAVSASYLFSLASMIFGFNSPSSSYEFGELSAEQMAEYNKTSNKGWLGRTWGWLKNTTTGDTLAKAGMLGLTYYMTKEQMKVEGRGLRSSLELQKVTARMNQCSSMDCTVMKDMCLSELVKCRADVKFLGIKWGRKDDMCFRRDMGADTDERKYCDTICPAEYTNKQVYNNPYTGETKQMSMYEICLMNVTNSLLNQNKCFDLITLNMKNPGMISDQQIRNCFLGLNPSRNTSTIAYNPGNIAPSLKTADAAGEGKKEEEGKSATAGSGAGGTGVAAPGSGVKDREKGYPDDRPFGSYSGRSESRPGTATSPQYGYGTYNASGEGSATGLEAPRTIEVGNEPSAKTMIGRHHSIAGDKIGTK